MFISTQLHYNKNERAKKDWKLNHLPSLVTMAPEDIICEQYDVQTSSDKRDHSIPIERAKFLTVCDTGDTEKVIFPLKEDIDTNQKDGEITTAVILTSQGVRTKTVQNKCSSDKGEDKLNMEENDVLSVLIHASSEGHTEVVKLLLDCDAPINMQNNDGLSALMCASCNGHTEVVSLLLDHNAQVNMQENDGWFALMHASSEGHTEVAKLLLDRDAQVNMQKNTGLSALMCACSNGHTEVVN